MSDPDQQHLDNSGQKPPKPGTFKKGFDQRRWLKGRPRVPKNAKKILDHLLWEVASEELEHPVTKERVDRLRQMLRNMTTSKSPADRKEFLDRLVGKVTEKVDVTSNGETIQPKANDDERFDRAISSLADAIREIVPGTGTKADGKLDAAE